MRPINNQQAGEYIMNPENIVEETIHGGNFIVHVGRNEYGEKFVFVTDAYQNNWVREYRVS